MNNLISTCEWHNPLTQFTDILGLLLICKEYITCPWIIVTLAKSHLTDEYLFQFSVSLNNIWLRYNKKS